MLFHPNSRLMYQNYKSFQIHWCNQYYNKIKTEKNILSICTTTVDWPLVSRFEIKLSVNVITTQQFWRWPLTSRVLMITLSTNHCRAHEQHTGHSHRAAALLSLGTGTGTFSWHQQVLDPMKYPDYYWPGLFTWSTMSAAVEAALSFVY